MHFYYRVFEMRRILANCIVCVGKFRLHCCKNYKYLFFKTIDLFETARKFKWVSVGKGAVLTCQPRTVPDTGCFKEQNRARFSSKLCFSPIASVPKEKKETERGSRQERNFSVGSSRDARVRSSRAFGHSGPWLCW